MRYLVSWSASGWVVVLLAVMTVWGCAGPPPVRSARQAEQDQELAQRVHTTLEGSQVYKFPQVQVDVFDGTVQLSGFVGTKAQRKYAGDMAERVVGVARVENDLIVRPVPW